MMNNKNLFLIVVVLVIAGIGGFLLFRYPPQDHSAMQSSSTDNGIFTLQLKDYHNNPISLADLKGKPIVINSWAAWCPFCRKELVDFAAAQKELGDRVVIIAVDRAESLEVAKKYSDELGVTNDLTFLLDPGDSFYRIIGGFSMPETIFVNSQGETVFHKRGPMDLAEMREKIQQLISQ